ncbi:hypothetical protein LPC08_22965 [Roseomonas sp. OT10]|uniref:hypothetical protein n=1 Tax=Roseomonas cutis TaxID=2897332 RepID=UPI001E2D1BE6|nr:hypothetical protein [Roseomonas sp. OT10]UFN48828.1 hypothetical protein LPC08_22965 [Roseomonas sp. OT10]
MMQPLITAGQSLAEALTQENEALARLDFAGAGRLADAKLRASDAFAAAFAAARGTGARVEGDQREATRELSTRLSALSEENRRLLQRAIALQSRVIETIAGAALPRAQPDTYGEAGLRPVPRQTPPLTFAARV